MRRNVDYVLTGVRELPSGHFEASWTLLHGPGHRGKTFVLRHQLEHIAELVQRDVETSTPPPTGPR